MANKASDKVLDFSGVKERGNFNPKQVPEGDYAAIITKVEDAEAKSGGDFMYVFTIKLDKFSQHSYPYYCKLTENQLWKLRNIAVAAGLNIPKKRLKFDPNKIVGKHVGVTMVDDEYEGKMKGQVDAIFPISELADGPEMEDETAFEEGGEAAPVMAGDDEFDPEEVEEPKAKKKEKKKKAEPEAEAEEPEAEEKPKKKKDKKKKKDVEELDITDV